MIREIQNIFVTTQEEAELIKKAADTKGIGKSKYMRDHVLKKAKKDVKNEKPN
jgi:uncharacterized protein (DUF1778 family)